MSVTVGNRERVSLNAALGCGFSPLLRHIHAGDCYVRE